MRRKEFEDMLVFCGFGMDKPVIDKLFYLFDENNQGFIDFKELLVGIEVSRQNKLRNLVSTLISIADIREVGMCTEPMLSLVFCAICLKPDEKVRLRNFSKST